MRQDLLLEIYDEQSFTHGDTAAGTETQTPQEAQEQPAGNALASRGDHVLLPHHALGLVLFLSPRAFKTPSPAAAHF